MSKLDDILEQYKNYCEDVYGDGKLPKQSYEPTKQQIKDLMLELINDVNIPKTDCAEFYIDGNDEYPSDEHHYRSGRFAAQMEITDILEQKVSDL